MKIHVYAMVHNEEILLPYFLRHYKTFAERIVLFDNESTDKTVEIAKDAGATVIPYPGPYSDRFLLDVKNERYKESRGKADWVIAVDADEFIWCPNIKGTLERYTKDGVTVVVTQGYDMHASAPPTGNGQIYEEIKHGIATKWYCKRAVFNPEVDINFDIGAHFCNPKGRVKHSPDGEVKLLHYRCLGPKFLADRWRERVARQSEENVKNKWSPVIGTTDASADWWMKSVRKDYPLVQVVP